MSAVRFNIEDMAKVMSEEEIAAFLSEMSPQEVLSLKYQWPFWARRGQLPPEGKWTYWMLLAGRGYGKTRVGAEWVRSIAEAGTVEYIHLIAPTNGDIRKVMLEGESGLLNISPSWFMPKYEPSKSRVVWPNGVKAYLFSAEEPDRLRGPQCFPAGTLISTEGGPVPIESVVPGDMVYTRNGLRMVVNSFLSSPSEELMEITTDFGRVIRCTRAHRVIQEGVGLVEAQELRIGDTLCAELISTEEHTTSAQTDISALGTRTINQLSAFYTGQCGFLKTVQYRSVLKFTTGMKTALTTKTLILNFLRSLNIQNCTDSLFSAQKLELQGHSLVPQQGTRPRWLTELAKSVTQCSSRKNYQDLSKGSARSGATESNCEGNHSVSADLVLSAEHTLIPRSHLPKDARHAATAIRCESIVSIKEMGVSKPVYNLSVAGTHEYFANGILVGNCGAFWADELAAWEHLDETWSNIQFGFRLGRSPQGVITTTPRPLALVKKLNSNPNCKVTKGSTYDNRANLAEPFFEEVITAYEGTRLGRQELNGEILEDNPNSLFQQRWFDKSRLEQAPADLEKIIVAVDPNVKENIDSDECGIVIVGMKTIDGVKHYYVLSDATIQPETMDEWGREVVKQYFMWQADRVIAETNNGGALVIKNITSVNADIPCEEVTATRGKTKRAEPIATLCEQGRVHFCGKFMLLETQCIEWDPTLDAKKGAQKSPDRMDAFVWGVAHLSGMKGKGMVQGRAMGN